MRRLTRVVRPGVRDRQSSAESRRQWCAPFEVRVSVRVLARARVHACAFRCGTLGCIARECVGCGARGTVRASRMTSVSERSVYTYINC